MGSIFEVNTKLSFLDYLVLVESIADEYFDESGNYVPHYGNLNCMMKFYNLCVTKSDYDEKYPHDLYMADDMEELVEDDNFIEAFNNALELKGEMKYDFAHAYKDALEIVNTNKTSLNYTLNQFEKAAERIIATINETLSDENMGIVRKLAEELSDGKLGTSAIVEKYSKELEKLKEKTEDKS